MLIPDAMVSPGVNLRDMMTEIAHEGHPGATNMKRYLRSRVWFPQMDLKVEEITSGCLPCQASTVRKHRDPLIPTEPPDEVWQDCATDHWGPTPEGKYLLVIIDRLSRYSEVKIVNGTSAEANIEAFDEIFSRNGYCETLLTDNGPLSMAMKPICSSNTLTGLELRTILLGVQKTQKQTGWQSHS